MHPKPVAVSSRGGIFNSLLQISTAFWSEMPANRPLRVLRTVAENLEWILSNTLSAWTKPVSLKAKLDAILPHSPLLRYGENSGGLHACGATFLYIVPLPNIFLTRLFSKQRLKRKDFQEIARLAWAQDVPSSNLGAPTNHFLVYQQL